jgi:hypothetical protein
VANVSLQRCYEFEALIATPDTMRTVLPLDARYGTRPRIITFAAGSRVCRVYSCEDILVDERMSFLDDFV